MIPIIFFYALAGLVFSLALGPIWSYNYERRRPTSTFHRGAQVFVVASLWPLFVASLAVVAFLWSLGRLSNAIHKEVSDD